MDTSRFDEQISEVGKQLEGLKKDLESTTGEFIEEAKKIASTWAEMNVRSAFKDGRRFPCRWKGSRLGNEGRLGGHHSG